MLCVGKTTLLKSKATSLARAGESVTYIFMGGSGKTEAVMSIANKIDFAYNPNITVLSQQDVEEKYRKEHPWWPSVPSPLSLLKFYIEKEKPGHLMVDEVHLKIKGPDDETSSLLKTLPALLPSTSSFLWLALHSSPLTDFTKGNLPKDELDNWRSSLTPTFTIPTLKHNLRNCNEVARVRGIDAGTTLSSGQSTALPTAPAFRPLPTLPPTPVCLPLHLPVHSTSSS